MRPNVGGIGLTMMWSTHDMIFMVFGKIGILDIFTELPRNASMRPKLNAIGLYMTWGTHDSIFMVFGNIVILTPKMLVATERDILAEFWRYHRDQRVKYPLWGDCEAIWRKFFADRPTHTQTHRPTDGQTKRLSCEKPVGTKRNFLHEHINYLKLFYYMKVMSFMKVMSLLDVSFWASQRYAISFHTNHLFVWEDKLEDVEDDKS